MQQAVSGRGAHTRRVTGCKGRLPTCHSPKAPIAAGQREQNKHLEIPRNLIPFEQRTLQNQTKKLMHL